MVLYGALDSHPFVPSHVASGRCVLSAAAAGAPAGVVSASVEPSGRCDGAVLDVAGCAVCASAAPSSWRIGGCAGCCRGRAHRNKTVVRLGGGPRPKNSAVVRPAELPAHSDNPPTPCASSKSKVPFLDPLKNMTPAVPFVCTALPVAP